MKTRIKFHCFPGDLCVQDKIALLENPKTKNGFRKLLKLRERATLKRQTEQEIKNSLKEL